MQSLTGVETKVPDAEEDRGGANGEGQEVCDGGDGDADTRCPEGGPDPLGHAQLTVTQGAAPRRHQQEHVVHPDTCHG